MRFIMCKVLIFCPLCQKEVPEININSRNYQRNESYDEACLQKSTKGNRITASFGDAR